MAVYRTLVRYHTRKNLSEYTTAALLASVCVHLLAFIAVGQKTLRAPEQYVFETTIEPPAAIKKQIVSPSDTESQTPPEKTARLSDKDTRVAQEQIRRGDSPLAGNAGSRPRAHTPQPKEPLKKAIAKEPAKTPSTPQAKKASPETPRNAVKKSTASAAKKTLDLSPPKEYLNNLPTQTDTPKQESKSSETLTPSSTAKPFSRPQGSGAQFQGFRGNSDFLPSIKDGDITLLNAKADRYAVFVRRVATRIFHLLKQYSWEFVHKSDYQSLNKHATVKAVLSTKGAIISVTLQDSSGSVTFDRITQRAIKNGASDPNAPASAAKHDGNIHFIFLARSWSQSVQGRRGLEERRWLSLQTGLE